MKIIIATSNKNKIFEFQKLLGDYEIFVASDFVQNFNPIENANSFEENAKIKALALWEQLSDLQRQNSLIIADDSGLCVDELNYAPGVLSARFGDEFKDKIANKDERNRLKLRLQLQKIRKEKAKASFVCVICFIKNGEIGFAKGECFGEVFQDELGENGFGYDKMFVANGYQLRFSQLCAEEKNKISHRFLAIKKLKEILNL